jgi:hypothetical protein
MQAWKTTAESCSPNIKPTKLEKDGYIRVHRDSEEFESLPASIRMFKPVYVTIEDHPFGSPTPANIGLCKNGFGIWLVSEKMQHRSSAL